LLSVKRSVLELASLPIVIGSRAVRRLRRAITAGLGLALVPALWAEAGSRPNILIILADDLGWADLACYGNPFIDTPQLDALAREGMRFENAYASPVCSPSRAEMQTGRYAARLKMTEVPNGHRRPWEALIPPEHRWQLPPAETTLAEALAPAGYTAAIIGKWHLGFRPGHQPADQGYASVPTGPLSGAYAAELEKWLAANPEKGVGAQLRQVVRFIEARREAPFLCIASFATVHTPLEARKELIRKYRQRAATFRTTIDPTYAAMVEVLDEAVGWLKRVLVEQGLADDTLIVFMSDNGGVIEERGFLPAGAPDLVTHNWPLRGEKGELYEGGIRVPWIVRWPGRVPAGRIQASPIHMVDILPTLVELAGVPPPDVRIDGVSQVPVLLGNSAAARPRPLFWHYPHYHHSVPASAMREGRYKLIRFHDTGASELYDLEADVGERNDLAGTNPEQAARLGRSLDAWLTGVGADLPRVNPFFDRERRLLWGERVSRERMADEQVPFGLP
jgi:uncharacterized sulfatase